MQYKTGLTSAAILASTAFAASNSTADVPSSCSIKADATASAQADLDKYSGCKTLAGDLVVSGDLGSAALANVQEIQGSLIITNATSLSAFYADSLKTISDSLTLTKLTVLDKASFGSLEEVDSIQFITLPAISTITTNLKSAKKILITDTSLESIEGFEELEQVEEFNVNNNKGLASIDSQLKSVSDILEVTFNGDQADITFDKLIWANNITLRDVSSASFASLQKVNASLGFINNSIESLKLTKLQEVGSALSIISNDELTEADFGNLTTVGGGFVVANNTKLKVIDGFSQLKTVGGALVVAGNFTELDLDSLKSVRGGADVETKAGNYSCDSLKSLQKKGGIQGDSFVCKNGATSTSIKLTSTSGASTATDDSSSTKDSSESSTATGSSSSSSSKSNGGAAGQFAPASSFMGAVAAVAVALL